MLYKKNNTPELDMELFKNPASEYRAAPFWAWNCELEKEELLGQIDYLKEMGMGGFHIHSRSGMATKYLSEDFMQLVKACVEKAKKENMLVWLYDEDRWPSGMAGGYVTETLEFRERKLVFTVNPMEDVLPKEEAIKEGKAYALGSYDIKLNKDGELISYRRLKQGEKAEGILRYAYVVINQPITPGWYNGGTYVDTLNPKAIERFVEITHERECEKKSVKLIPSMIE